MNDMDRVAGQWLAARAVVVDFLRELVPWAPQANVEHNAAALLARLASNDPPILLAYRDELKE